MNLDFLKGRRCTEVIRNEYSWQFVFGNGCSLTVECPWRIVAGGRIAVAHSDHQQQFGLAKPIDVSADTLKLLATNPVVDVAVVPETSDLSIDFDGGARFQLFTDSSGYESWQIQDPDGQFWIGRND